jgi:hypothetical protein
MTDEQLQEYPARVKELEKALATLSVLRSLFDTSTVRCDHCGACKSVDQGDRIHYERTVGAIQKIEQLIVYMNQQVTKGRRERRDK